MKTQTQNQSQETPILQAMLLNTQNQEHKALESLVIRLNFDPYSLKQVYSEYFNHACTPYSHKNQTLQLIDYHLITTTDCGIFQPKTKCDTVNN